LYIYALGYQFRIATLDLADCFAGWIGMIGKVNRCGKRIRQAKTLVDSLGQHVERREALAEAVDSHAQADSDYQNGPIPIEDLGAGKEQQDHRGHADRQRQGALIQRQLSKQTPAGAFEEIR
jgi:hypothetical protein